MRLVVAAAGRSSSGNGRPQAERRILLIEDSAVLSRRLVDLLSEPGRVSVTAQAATQAEALLRLQEGTYDVLVVDIELAEGNGVGVIRQVRQLYPPDAQPLVVVLTNYASDFVRDHCFAAGADYFLDKMRDISLLKSVVVDGQSKWSPPN
ncbi:MAG TPA: response regulator [Steroidobacteraceae bacterium]